MSESCAVVDVVGTESCSGQFLEEIVLFVAAFGGREDSDAVRAVLLFCSHECCGGEVKGLVPADFLQGAVFPQQRGAESFVRMDELVEVPSFGTEISAADGVAFARI